MTKYKITIASAVAFLFFYFSYLSYTGWGYVGYSKRNGYAPSFWYWGHPTIYPNMDLRSGSVGGRGTRGGGPGAGK